VRLTLIRRRKQSRSDRVKKTSFMPESFVLCDRSSGALLFRVDADTDGGLPVEKAAGLLAVHCLVRGQVPEDYEVMVVAQRSLLHAVAERTQQLLAAGRALGSGVKISRREHEVLDGILQRLANKEIASKLNVSERTVKFHVSSLLAKFGVSDRVALSREVAMGRMPPSSVLPESQNLFGFPVQQVAGTENPGRPDSTQAPTEAAKPKGGVFSIFQRERYAT
jgi:DNA-binding CsgD family transcriptional regulator